MLEEASSATREGVPLPNWPLPLPAVPALQASPALSEQTSKAVPLLSGPALITSWPKARMKAPVEENSCTRWFAWSATSTSPALAEPVGAMAGWPIVPAKAPPLAADAACWQTLPAAQTSYWFEPLIVLATVAVPPLSGSPGPDSVVIVGTGVLARAPVKLIV